MQGFNAHPHGKTTARAPIVRRQGKASRSHACRRRTRPISQSPASFFCAISTCRRIKSRRVKACCGVMLTLAPSRRLYGVVWRAEMRCSACRVSSCSSSTRLYNWIMPSAPPLCANLVVASSKSTFASRLQSRRHAHCLHISLPYPLPSPAVLPPSANKPMTRYRSLSPTPNDAYLPTP